MKRIHVVVGVVILFFIFLAYIAVRLAMRDAEDTADFVFKVFGAFMALLISSVGPFGVIGLAIFKGKQLGGNLPVVFLAAGLVSLLLLVYVLIRLDVFSLFVG